MTLSCVTFEAMLLKVVQLLPGPLLGHLPFNPATTLGGHEASHKKSLVGVPAPVLADSQHQSLDVSQ